MTTSEQHSHTESANRLCQASDRVARWVSGESRYTPDGLSPGEIAELRRLSPSDPSSPSFWKVLGRLEDIIEMPISTDALVLAERRWAAFFNAAALVAGPGTQEGAQLGQALYEAGFSELRFVRLLRARGDALFHGIRGAAQFLAAKGQSVDIYGFARLLFSDTTARREVVRRDIARTYYKYSESKTKEN